MWNLTHRWWERGEMIGTGSTSHVYLARPTPKSPYSSLFPPLMAVKSTFYYDSIKSEKQILSRLRGHPNIINLYFYDVTMDNSELVHNMFMEYASDGSLLDQINLSRGGLSETDVSGYVKDVLIGLDTIHELGYVHCDIKPENILIVDGVAKIADFGLATKAMVGEKVKGTVEYVAPEVVSESNYTLKADIWALGITVLTAISGDNIWGPRVHRDELLRLIGYSDVLPIIPNGLSSLAVDFVSKCLVKDYQLRWTAKMLLNHPFVKRMISSDI